MLRLDDALDEFLIRCEAVNLSAETVRWYRDLCRRFVVGVAAAGVTDAEAVKPADVLSFVAGLRRRGCAPATANAYLRALSAWFGWLVRDELLVKNPLARTERLKQPSGTRVPLRPDEAQRLLAAFDRRRFSGLRDFTLCRLFLETGLRLSEATGLVLNDVSVEERRIVVRHGKGDRRRMVRFGHLLTLDLRRYLRVRSRRPGADAVPWVFYSTRTLQALQRCSVTRSFARAARRAGLPRRVGAHLLRHTAATWLAENGATAFEVQSELGHARLQTSQEYVHLAHMLAGDAYEAVSPLNRLQTGNKWESRPKEPHCGGERSSER